MAKRPVPKPRRVVAFCGIGNPAAFLTDLEADDLDVVSWRTYRDHQKYTMEQWRDLSETALEKEAVLVTTEKDLVRLPEPALANPNPPLVALCIEPVVHDEAVLLDRVETLLATRSESAPARVL